MKVICAVIAFILIAVNGCSGHQDPAPVVRPQKGSELCDEVCLKMESLPEEDGTIGCFLAEPVPVKEEATVPCMPDEVELGCITCDEWCVEQHQNGIFWNTECIMDQATTCSQVDTLCNIQ